MQLLNQLRTASREIVSRPTDEGDLAGNDEPMDGITSMKARQTLPRNSMSTPVKIQPWLTTPSEDATPAHGGIGRFRLREEPGAGLAVAKSGTAPDGGPDR